jgi:hypothetical protein
MFIFYSNLQRIKKVIQTLIAQFEWNGRIETNRKNDHEKVCLLDPGIFTILHTD